MHQHSIRLGVYAGPANPAGVLGWARGARIKVKSGFDYLSDADWSTISNPSWDLSKWEGGDLSMIFGVPMLPASGASLAAGAAGTYDGYFRSLADDLVVYKQARATLVLGWSPLENTLPWRVQTARQATFYREYFRHIVSAMRSVPKEHFVFAFEPGPVAGSSAVPLQSLDPGRAYCADIAVSVFDVLSLRQPIADSRRWSVLVGGRSGPDALERLAVQTERRLIVTSLALAPPADEGAGDDAAFVTDFFRWAETAHVASVTIWDLGPAALEAKLMPTAFAALQAALHLTRASS
jgi:hypothetical protein